MKTFDLELRVTTHGSIITWKVLLEDSTNNNNIVLDWAHHADGYRYKKLPGYRIDDNSLEVFAACHGIQGGTLTCQILIGNVEQKKKVIARVEDKTYAKASYKINESL